MNEQDFLPRSELNAPIIRGPGEGPLVGVLGSHAVLKVLPEETGGAYAVLEQRVLPGHGPPLHVHRHETEVFYIVSGEFEVRIGDRQVRALPGALVAGPRDIPHTFRNVGATDGTLLLTIIPGGFANYFRELHRIEHIHPEAIRQLSSRYGVEILE